MTARWCTHPLRGERSSDIFQAGGVGERDGSRSSTLEASERAGAVQQGTLLVAEDDEILLECLSAALGDAGYRVLGASSVSEATRIFATEREVDLVVADVIMPVGDGPQLVDRLRAIRPDVLVLFMSGYRAEELTRFGLLRAGDAFVGKPFSSEDLSARVAEMLEGRGPRAES